MTDNEILIGQMHNNTFFYVAFTILALVIGYKLIKGIYKSLLKSNEYKEKCEDLERELYK